MHTVVSFEIISGIFDEPFDFAGEHHFREHGSVVIGLFFRGPVPDGKGYGCGRVLYVL